MSGAPLLRVVQGLLERTYGRTTSVGDVARFVIGDAGYRRLYSGAEVRTVAGDGDQGARTLVRETDDGVRASIYYPDALISILESHPPQHGVGEENVDAFGALVEEVDHLLLIAERVEAHRPFTLLELEFHANVSKELVLARFLAGRRPRLERRERLWLRWHLFHKADWEHHAPEVRSRYHDAARFGLRFLERLEGRSTAERLRTLRRFHASGLDGKLAMARGTAP
ncbi:MAG TPA: hypothetical protein VF139_19160 [Candidatus Polarisedimenticolaceae bacterium]|jgi:hypothetical protein